MRLPHPHRANTMHGRGEPIMVHSGHRQRCNSARVLMKALFGSAALKGPRRLASCTLHVTSMHRE